MPVHFRSAEGIPYQPHGHHNHVTHHHGEADHLAWLERPFAEALSALEERDGG